MNRCDFHEHHDEQGQPAGERCGETATHMIAWTESKQFSMACEPHSRPEAILTRVPYTVSALVDGEKLSFGGMAAMQARQR